MCLIVKLASRLSNTFTIYLVWEIIQENNFSIPNLWEYNDNLYSDKKAFFKACSEFQRLYDL